MNASTFEIHPAGLGADEPSAVWAYSQARPVPALLPLAVAEPDKTLWVTVERATGQIQQTADAAAALAGFRLVHRRLGAALAMLAMADGILVNGLSALPLSVLTTRDSVTLAPGCLYYVTERIRPFLGAPTGELLGKKCPLCRLAPDPQSRVLVCVCGAPYHWETAGSHPQTPEKDRLH